MNHSRNSILAHKLVSMDMSLKNLDSWVDLEKTCTNLIYGLTPRIKINVCGYIYEIYTETLDAYPDTLLGDPERREKHRLNSQMLFFHRHPTFFSYILYYYIQGFIQRPNNIPEDIFIEECRYFSIPFQYTEDKHLILHFNELKLEKNYFYFISLSITILSCLILFFIDLPNLIWIEMFCIIWFTIEFYIRFFYFELDRNFDLFIDIISITPVFLFLLTNTLSEWFPYLTLLYPFYICLKSFRIFRLIRYISTLDLIRKTLFLSLNNLSISLILCSLFIIQFGVTIYLIERTDPHSNIIDPNIGYSWAIETLTTIGFGEYIPHTYQGRFLSIFACIFGLIILAIPMPIIFRKFEIIYQNSLKKDLWIKYR